VENFSIFKQRLPSHEAAIVQPQTSKREDLCACLRVASAAPAASFKSVYRKSDLAESPLRCTFPTTKFIRRLYSMTKAAMS
jgi:hypothetical protein